MAKYRKKPVVVEVTQWFKHGDHPAVRYFRRPDVDGESLCSKCGIRFHDHGWIDTLEGGHIVCPADQIITGVQNENYPCKPSIFEATYEAVQE